jgi:RNA polymerase sigma-70 factor, ECF subfamily
VHRNDPSVRIELSHSHPSVGAASRVVAEQNGWEHDSPFSMILDRARSLDKQALGLLYERYLAIVYRFVYLRVGDTHVAEDLTADVFFSVVAHIQQLHATDELTFAAWILRIARNTVLAHFRTMRAQPPTESVSQLALTTSAEEGDPLAVITAREDWSAVVSALNALTEDQRNVVLYRCLLGYSAIEVGRLLEKRPGAIRALQFRALTTLARLLDQSTLPGEDVPDQAPALAVGKRRVHGIGQ